MKKKRDVRLQVFVSADVDDRLDELCEIMGLRKNELVRVAIANYLFSLSESVDIVKAIADKQMQEEVENEDQA